MLTVALALLAALQVAAVWCAWRAIASARTPQGAVGWVVFLLAAPYAAVPAYLFLGHHRYSGYLVARRASIDVIEAIRRQAAAHAPATPPAVDPTPFERIAALPAVRGNAMRPLIDGAEAFAAMFAAIDAARHYVLVQVYILRDDGLGRAFRDRLESAAARGVTVRLLFDEVGSWRLPNAYLDSLRDAGVQVADPRRRPRFVRRFRINYRNHRKTLVVDGETGFTGGLNMGDEYLGRDPEMGPWRDTQVELRGPVVSQLQLIFAEDWHYAEGEVLNDALRWTVPEEPEDMTALLVATGPADTMETGGLFFYAAIAAARRRIWIASAYCVPDTDILTALKFAALKGVEVRILVPEVVDHRIPWLAAFAYFDELRAAGVEIWRYDAGFMHQKAVLVDEDFAAIGTMNLDNRSFRLNFEAMAAFFDSRAAARVAAMLEADFARSFRMERSRAEQPSFIRVGAPVARLFAPLL